MSGEDSNREFADTSKIISKLWLLSTRTENIDLLIDNTAMWTPEEKLFLLHLPDQSLKCNAFYSKIVHRDNQEDKINLMKALRSTKNDFVADEISSESEFPLPELVSGNADSSSSLEKLVGVAAEVTSSSEIDDEDQEIQDSIITADSSSLANSLDDSFTPIQLEQEKTKEKGNAGESTMIPSIITYEFNGLIQTAPSKLVDFGFKVPIQKIQDPRGIFISESYYQRITILSLSDFIIHQNHLIQALQPCAVVEVLELKNVFFDPQSLQHHGKPGMAMTAPNTNKLWFPKLRKFVFHSKSIPNTVYTTEGYSWDTILFFEASKGNPANLRNIWQGRTVDISVKTLSLEVEVNHAAFTVSLTLFRRHFNSLPIIPEYFLDSFLRNCGRIQFLQVHLPELCAKIDFDSMPQELVELHLSGFAIVGSFLSMKPIEKIFLSNCVLPDILLRELQGILPLTKLIQFYNCHQENGSVQTPINVKIKRSN